MKENPAYYEPLLERLQKILDETKINWIERKKRLEEFINNDVEQGATDEASNLGFDEKEFAFFKVVKKYLDEDSNGEADFVVNEDGETYVSNETIELSKEIAKDVKNVVKENYVIDWVTNPTKTNDIQRAIKLMLIKKYAKKLSKNVREKIIEPLLNLAKIHFDVIN